MSLNSAEERERERKKFHLGSRNPPFRETEFDIALPGPEIKQTNQTAKYIPKVQLKNQLPRKPIFEGNCYQEYDTTAAYNRFAARTHQGF